MTKCTIPWNKEFDKDKKYIWISETGKNTCEECKSLDGKIFTGDKVPLRPHPNCKCEVKEYSNENNSSINKITEPENTELIVLKQEAEELERKVTVLNAKIIQTEAIDIEENYDKELEKIIEDFTKVKQKKGQTYQKYGDEPVIIEIKNTLNTIQQKINKMYLESDLSITKKLKKSKEISNMSKAILDIGINTSNVFSSFPDASALWDISSSKFQSKSAQKYIMLNGQIVEKVSDLNDRHLEIFIKNKLNEQLQTNESRGIFFDNDSSLSKAIIQDTNFQEKIKEIVKENKNKLIFKRIADDTSFGGFSSKDLRNALGNVDIIDIYIDNDYSLNALLIDTYDFNKNEMFALVQMGRALQENNIIENYYVIIPIKIPLQQWKKF